MNYVRRLIIAVFVLALIISAWYGAEMLIHGESQKSVVDTLVSVCLALGISGKIEKGVEQNERKQEFAEKFAEEFVKSIKERTETENGKDANG